MPIPVGDGSCLEGTASSEGCMVIRAHSPWWPRTIGLWMRVAERATVSRGDEPSSPRWGFEPKRRKRVYKGSKDKKRVSKHLSRGTGMISTIQTRHEFGKIGKFRILPLAFPPSSGKL